MVDCLRIFHIYLRDQHFINTTMKNPFVYLLIAFMALTSCSSDDDKGSTGSREIKYEITGNYSGAKLDITYTENGGATNTEATKLPWTKTFTAASDTFGAGFNAGAGDAKPGEKITLNIYQGGKLKKSQEATATSDGMLIASVTATF